MTYDVELENKLRKWRESLDDVMELHRNNDTPHRFRRFKNGWGCISERNIQTLVINKPRTKHELLKLEDFGKIKVEKYGEDILELINLHEKNHEDEEISYCLKK